MNKPLASLSLDLDDCWAFLKTHGETSWEEYPSYFPTAVPRVLDHLKLLNQKITFFVVGKDATFDHNKELISNISEHGHEIGNHTFHHDPWIQYFERSKIEDELMKAEDAIANVTGVETRGFRGPAFTFSPELLNVLASRNYLYDASTLPNILNPISRAYFFSGSKLSEDDLKKRGLVFGKWQDGLRSLRAYRWSLDQDQYLLEIPVSTFPIIRFPIHLTYILYLGTYSKKLAITYFRLAVKLFRVFNIDLSVLLSPTDYLGKEDNHRLPFFPAMNLPVHYKFEILDEVIRIMQKHFKVVPIREHATNVNSRNGIKIKQPMR